MIISATVITAAAGFPTTTTGDLIEVIGRQAPGTWLPLEVLRSDVPLKLIAKFPQQFTKAR